MPWLASTKRLLRAYAGRGVPVLGICLGHQLLAVACGGEVRPNPDGPQRGLFELGLTAEAGADPLLGGLTPPVHAVQWNNDVVTRLPPGAVLLARTPSGRPQAIRVGAAAWGVQFHPEAGGAQVRRWASKEGDGTAGQRRADGAAASTVAAADAVLARTWSAVAARFARLAAAPPARP